MQKLAVPISKTIVSIVIGISRGRSPDSTLRLLHVIAPYRKASTRVLSNKPRFTVHWGECLRDGSMAIDSVAVAIVRVARMEERVGGACVCEMLPRWNAARPCWSSRRTRTGPGGVCLSPWVGTWTAVAPAPSLPAHPVSVLRRGKTLFDDGLM